MGPLPDVRVAWVDAGRIFGLGRMFEGGIWTRSEAAVTSTDSWLRAASRPNFCMMEGLRSLPLFDVKKLKGHQQADETRQNAKIPETISAQAEQHLSVNLPSSWQDRPRTKGGSLNMILCR